MIAVYSLNVENPWQDLVSLIHIKKGSILMHMCITWIIGAGIIYCAAYLHIRLDSHTEEKYKASPITSVREVYPKDNIIFIAAQEKRNFEAFCTGSSLFLDNELSDDHS